VSSDEGALIEPTACCVRAIRKANVQAGRSAVVFGVGPVGLTHVQLLKSYGLAPVFAVDVIKSRRDMAANLGADLAFDPASDDVPKAIANQTLQLGVDYAVVATANLKALEQAIKSVRKGGMVLLFGAPARGASVSLDMSYMFLHEVSFQSSYSTSETEMRIALNLIESKRIKPAQLISHRFPLSQAVEALNVADKAVNAVKVVVENK
jgi:L-iditol 2-dehydrogenase